jgi:hypothetical protein
MITPYPVVSIPAGSATALAVVKYSPATTRSACRCQVQEHAAGLREHAYRQQDARHPTRPVPELGPVQHRAVALPAGMLTTGYGVIIT